MATLYPRETRKQQLQRTNPWDIYITIQFSLPTACERSKDWILYIIISIYYYFNASIDPREKMVITINFITYFATALFLTSVFMYLYKQIMPHNGVELMKQNNTAAVISFGGALIGFVIPLAVIIYNSNFIGEVII